MRCLAQTRQKHSAMLLKEKKKQEGIWFPDKMCETAGGGYFDMNSETINLRIVC